jgi:hypothetical protein
MKIHVPIYSFLVCWLSGWIAGRFDLLHAAILSLILFLPLFITMRVKREYSNSLFQPYILLSATMTICLSLVCYIVTCWLATGIDHKVIFQREYAEFK